jgi:hypothetical protein
MHEKNATSETRLSSKRLNRRSMCPTSNIPGSQSLRHTIY